MYDRHGALHGDFRTAETDFFMTEVAFLFFSKA